MPTITASPVTDTPAFRTTQHSFVTAAVTGEAPTLITIRLILLDGKWTIEGGPNSKVPGDFQGRIIWLLPVEVAQHVRFIGPGSVVFKDTAGQLPNWDLDPLWDNASYSVAWFNQVQTGQEPVKYTYNVQLELTVDPTVENDPPPPNPPAVA